MSYVLDSFIHAGRYSIGHAKILHNIQLKNRQDGQTDGCLRQVVKDRQRSDVSVKHFKIRTYGAHNESTNLMLLVFLTIL
jgi:hypothetical protein